MNEKIKGTWIALGAMWSSTFRNCTELAFQEKEWNILIDAMAEEKMNTVFVDLHEGLRYCSHPELAVDGSWTKQKMRKEIRRLKDMGITMIPKLNFSAIHDFWLRQYRLVRSTPEYYRVCRELITEVCDLFEDAPYFHIGMDEEDNRHASMFEDFVIYRKGKAFWNDMQFYLDCVRDCKKVPVVWQNIFNYHEFKENVPPEDIIVMPWNYFGMKPEHWIRTDSREDYYEYYYVKGPYAGKGMEIIERDDPFHPLFREVAHLAPQDGYECIFCCSNFYEHEHNADDTVDLVKNVWGEHNMLGIITATWTPTLREYRERNVNGIKLLSQAFKKYNY